MKLSIAMHIASVPEDFCLQEYDVGKFDGKILYIFKSKTTGRGLKFIFWSNGQLNSKWYTLDDLVHRDPKEGPAILSFDKHGSIASIEYLLNGKYHRDPEDGPAIKAYSSEGYLISEEYRLNGVHQKPKKLIVARFDPKECELLA